MPKFLCLTAIVLEEGTNMLVLEGDVEVLLRLSTVRIDSETNVLE